MFPKLSDLGRSTTNFASISTMSLQILRSRASSSKSLKPHNSAANELVISKLWKKSRIQFPLLSFNTPPVFVCPELPRTDLSVLSLTKLGGGGCQPMRVVALEGWSPL
jgi:hypothetical protein